MKNYFIIAVFIFSGYCVNAQTAITAVTTSNSTAPTTFSYTNAGTTYNWGISPNNTITTLNGFTAGGIGYSYASFLTGNVKLRRVNNPGTTGNFTLVWAEYNLSGSNFNMFPDYQNDMESFFNNRIYNKGTDNLFDNTSSNSNNIERLDWILNASYSTPAPSKVGFAVFERGATGAHDPFCIAAITSLDGFGNPASYGNIVRVSSAQYGDPGPNVTYRILKAQYPNNLLDAGTNTQSRGGVIISLQALGIAPNTPIYGYSLFSSDLPLAATPADLVDYTNATYFPTNTGNPGGIDLIAVTGIYIENTLLPTRFISFNAVENDNLIKLKWQVENETSVNRYEIERSTDGVNYFQITQIQNTANSNGTNSYTYTDNVANILSNRFYYRIKQYDRDNSFYFSNTISISRNNKNTPISIYPNPVAETLFINIPSTVNDAGTISIINSLGAHEVQKKIQLSKGNNSFSIDRLNRLASGVYHLSIKLNSGRSISKEFLKN
jgi:hypothetical protein